MVLSYGSLVFWSLLPTVNIFCTIISYVRMKNSVLKLSRFGIQLEIIYNKNVIKFDREMNIVFFCRVHQRFLYFLTLII